MSACQTSEVTNFVGHALLSFVLAFVYSYPVLAITKKKDIFIDCEVQGCEVAFYPTNPPPQRTHHT